MNRFWIYPALLAPFLISPLAFADEYTITLKDHQWAPQELVIPANQKVNITVKNDSDSNAEFESSQFDREKVVKAHKQITVSVGPLKAGTYSYFDDFHEESTGKITAR